MSWQLERWDGPHSDAQRPLNGGYMYICPQGRVWGWAGRQGNIKAPGALELPPLGTVLLFSPRNQTYFSDASKRSSL